MYEKIEVSPIMIARAYMYAYFEADSHYPELAEEMKKSALESNENALSSINRKNEMYFELLLIEKEDSAVHYLDEYKKYGK